MLKKEPTAAAAPSIATRNRFSLQLVPLNSDWVIVNLCSCRRMWVVSTLACVMTFLFQRVLAQEVSLAVVCVFILRTISGLSLTKTF